MKNVYICHTNYHLLLSLIKLNIGDTNDIVVFENHLRKTELKHILNKIE